MKRTALIYLLIAVATAALYLVNLLNPGRLSGLLDMSFIVITFIGLAIIYFAGSLRRSWMNIPVLAGIIVAAAGAIFRIQHWPYGSIMLFSGLTITGAFYLLHFILKPAKHLLDYLKALWLLLRITEIILIFTTKIHDDLLTHLSSLLLLALIFLHLYQDHEKEMLLKKHSDHQQ